jgi:hypothetical protein
MGGGAADGGLLSEALLGAEDSENFIINFRMA